MNKGANAFAFIAGLSAGVLNMMCALTTLLNVLVAMEYVPNPALIPAVSGLLLVAGVSLAGGCVCRTRRVAGGILMLTSALVLLLFGAACLYLSLRMPDMFIDAFGAEFGEGVQRAALGAGVLLLFTELLSIAAGVVSLAMPAKPKTPAQEL